MEKVNKNSWPLCLPGSLCLEERQHHRAAADRRKVPELNFEDPQIDEASRFKSLVFSESENSMVSQPLVRQKWQMGAVFDGSRGATFFFAPSEDSSFFESLV